MAAAQQEAVTDQPGAGNHQAYLWAVVEAEAEAAAAVDLYLLDRHHPSLFHLL